MNEFFPESKKDNIVTKQVIHAVHMAEKKETKNKTNGNCQQ